jgi:hypothetical protein
VRRRLLLLLLLLLSVLRMNKQSLRLFISGAFAFLVGLLFAMPPVHFNQALFPNTRAMYTLHIEATQNGIMLIVMGFLSQITTMSPAVAFVFEVCAHLGAWTNIVPWLYIGVTGELSFFA